MEIVNPQTGRQVEEVMARFDQISNFQAVVRHKREKDELDINLELKSEAVDKHELTNDLAKTFQVVCRVKADNV